ncbi:MAG: acetyl-CoA carboxylase carboxyltransferase subunit alpha [Pirellulaceae bacterium]|nr:acetyl-CoA carboxylase carboxyltransferase subunit alpha [Pirellulaceae bacterium]
MDALPPGLAFEEPIIELEEQIRQLESADDAQSGKNVTKIRKLRKELADKTKEVYDNLSPWEMVQVARHKNRPHTPDYLSLCFEEFMELHGDRRFGDDRAILTGFAKIGAHKVMAIGHDKGKTYQERTACSFGCAHPEGYRKALLKMKMAEKYQIPIICFIDTPGAYPGIGAEERGISQAIAENLFEMSQVKTPIICVVIGEGGSGGAIGIGVGDRVAMLQNSYYSVISPEGCAGILWKSHKYAEQAAGALKFTADELLKFGVIDHIIEEPLGGAHRDPHLAANRLRNFFLEELKALGQVPLEQLLEERYEKFRKIGVFLEQAGESQNG